MGGWLDDLSKLAFMMGTVGGPILLTGNRKDRTLGAGLLGLGALGGVETQRSEAQRNRDAFQSLISGQLSQPNITPEQKNAWTLAQQAGTAGMKPEDIFKMPFMAPVFPKTQAQKTQLTFDKASGQWTEEPIVPGGKLKGEPVGAYLAGNKPNKPLTGFAAYEANKPEYTNYLNAERAAAAAYRTPPKSAAEIEADAEARTIGGDRARMRRPLSLMPGMTAIAPDGRLLPGATMEDVTVGKALPILRTDIKQIRETQAARKALDALDGTINSALPKTPGALSGAGTLGRKLTDIVNPSKLAKFNVAKLAASDTFIRALTQRGNKAQFDAALSSIVGPNATVGSAREGINTARSIIDGMNAELTNRAGSAFMGAPAESVPEEPTVEEPPPPPGFED